MKVTQRIVVLAAFLIVGALLEAAGAEEASPAGLVGFSGQTRGIVVEKGEESTFSFKVLRVLRVWKNNKAETPQALVGRTVPVGPRWVKGKDSTGHRAELQVALIKTLKAGEEITLELKHAERSHFAILELSAEQRQRASGE